jgi:peptide/nickel transport system substrate-binding protein
VHVYAHKPGFVQMTVFNNFLFPSNQKKLRQAIKLVQDPKEYMAVCCGPTALWELSPAIFFKGNKWETKVDEERYWEINIDKAKQLIAEAKKETGWDGKLVLMTNTDYPNLYQLGQITNRDLTQKLGLQVDFQIMDWATLVTRRAKKEGWNIFHTGWSFAGAYDPFVAGWASPKWFAYWENAQAQKLQGDFATAADDAARMKVVEEFQRLVYDELPIIPHGQNAFISVYNKARVRDYIHLDGCGKAWWGAWLAK